MNILCYSSCYGSIFKNKLISYNINNFDVIYWYDRPKHTINFNDYKNYNILICEYVSEKDNYYSSTIFIKNIKDINPNIKIVVYPLIILNIFPFHKHAFGFLSSYSINNLIEQNISNETIINLYNNDNIKFDPIKGFNISLNRLKYIEQFCDIKVSHVIEDKFYKEQICIDSIFPSNNIFNHLCYEIIRNLNIDIAINCNMIYIMILQNFI